MASGTWQGPYLSTEDLLTDPWGHKFVLRIPVKKTSEGFEVVSYGADDVEDGEGMNADIVKP